MDCSRGDADSDGFIDFLPDQEDGPEGVLYVMDRIDREALGADGVLNYTVTVTDGNNNQNTEKVNQICFISRSNKTTSLSGVSWHDAFYIQPALSN